MVPCLGQKGQSKGIEKLTKYISGRPRATKAEQESDASTNGHRKNDTVSAHPHERAQSSSNNQSRKSAD